MKRNNQIDNLKIDCRSNNGLPERSKSSSKRSRTKSSPCTLRPQRAVTTPVSHKVASSDYVEYFVKSNREIEIHQSVNNRTYRSVVRMQSLSRSTDTSVTVDDRNELRHIQPGHPNMKDNISGSGMSKEGRPLNGTNPFNFALNESVAMNPSPAPRRRNTVMFFTVMHWSYHQMHVHFGYFCLGIHPQIHLQIHLKMNRSASVFAF